MCSIATALMLALQLLHVCMYCTLSCVHVLLCNYLFRSILLEFGLWDQIRVDHGKEWYLMLYVQEKLSGLRRNQNRHPHVQTTSKKVV